MALKFEKPVLKKYLDNQMRKLHAERQKHISKRRDFMNMPAIQQRITAFQKVRKAIFGVELEGV